MEAECWRQSARHERGRVDREEDGGGGEEERVRHREMIWRRGGSPRGDAIIF